MKIQIPKKLRTEDFDSDSQDMVSKIGFIYNSFVDEVYQALNGRLDTDNLARKLVTINVIIDKNGNVVNPPQIKLDLPVRVSGVNVIRAVNLINPAISPTSAPFVGFSATSTQLTINYVLGLPLNSQFQLTLEIL